MLRDMTYIVLKAPLNCNQPLYECEALRLARVYVCQFVCLYVRLRVSHIQL